MDNEKNRIEYSNDIKTITNEYHDYDEYNQFNIQKDNYKEIASYKEYNSNKTTFKAQKISSGFVRLLSSAMIITFAVVMGTNFIFGPKSVIEDVYVDNYDNSLYVSILFSEYASDDDLELVVKNDFTKRVYEIEALEEGNEQDKHYMYFEEVLDLSPNSTYTVSIESGATVLYSERYTIPIKEDIKHTSVLNLNASYSDELIFVNIDFSYFNSDDYVLLQLEKDDEIYESIVIDEAMQNENGYYYDNSFSVIDEGNYLVKVYINDYLEAGEEIVVN